jgi:hypothetical protein
MRWARNCESRIRFYWVRGNSGEVVMRAILHVSVETMTAVLYIASFAVFVGAVAVVYTQSLRTGLLIAGTAFISGTLGFAYSVWRLYRPRWPVGA